MTSFARSQCSKAIAIILLHAGTLIGAGPDAPELVVRLNGHDLPTETALELTRGEPMIVEVQLRHADRAARTPLALDPPGDNWSSRVKIALSDSAGKTIVLPFVVAGQPSSGALSLQPDATTTLVLRLAAAGLERLVPGSYALTARLDLHDGRGWRGVAESEQADFSVVTPPPDLKDAALGDRQLLRVRDALLARDLARAETAANDLLATDFQRPEGFVAQALVAEAKGEVRLALVFIDLAMAHAAGVTDPALLGGSPAVDTPPPTPKPVPWEYYDLRRRFEALSTNKLAQEVQASPSASADNRALIPGSTTPASDAPPGSSATSATTSK